jgi:hypothetical protein
VIRNPRQLTSGDVLGLRTNAVRTRALLPARTAEATFEVGDDIHSGFGRCNEAPPRDHSTRRTGECRARSPATANDP